MPWNLESDKPIFIQIVEKLKNDILSSVYKPGEKIPSVRELAIDAGVNPNTMQKALQELERTGLIYTNRTSGKFVTPDVMSIKEKSKSTITETVTKFVADMRALDVDDNQIIELVKGEL